MPTAGPGANQRIDQWLWFARITKSRTLAQALVARGKVRVNRIKIEKPSTPVKPGDVLTLVLGPNVRSLEIVGIGARRGPATEAQLLFNDLTKAVPRTPSRETVFPDSQKVAPSGVRASGAGRPTKRERRQFDKLKSRSEL